MSVCIIGAGVIGLSTATAIQERMMTSGQRSSNICPVTSLTIVAERFGPGTTSYGSGGQICPYPPKGLDPVIAQQICQDSVDYFYKLAFSDQARQAGVNLVNGFQYTNDKNLPMLKSMLNVNEVDPDTKSRLPKGDQFKHVLSASTAMVDLPVHLKWLKERFLACGGKFIERKINNLNELAGQYDLVVNCTGMGASHLVQDPLLKPMRGQSVHVHAPWLKTFLRGEAKTYIFPFEKSVFIGSTKQLGQSDLRVSNKDTKELLKNAEELCPSLRGARVMWEWVGVRPTREPVRLEGEIIRCNNGTQLKVVHNYGHGSIGISLSRGCAVHVTNIVEQMLTSSSPTSSKL